jgi:hypothetical protein
MMLRAARLWRLVARFSLRSRTMHDFELLRRRVTEEGQQ